MSHGMESWHPNPEFFFKPGGGPILDVGPYYITQLVNLLGPVRRAVGLGTIGNATRTVTSEPLKGSTIDVEVLTTVNGVLEFVNGANISLSASWDVWKHNRTSPIEIYGTEGSLLGVDPNFFGNIPRVCKPNGDWQDVAIAAHPFGIANRELRNGTMQADYRIVGLVDMAMAIRHKPVTSGQRRSGVACAGSAGGSGSLIPIRAIRLDTQPLRAARAGPAGIG